MRPIELLVDSCGRVLPLLRSSDLHDHWSRPSALEEWSNCGLAGHLARSAFNLERSLDTRPSGHDRRDALTYYSTAEPPDSPIGRRIRELGDREAMAGPVELADRFAHSIAGLRDRALVLEPATTVEMFGRTLTIDDCATACLLELIVHADDLAVSINVPPPEFDARAVDLVVLTLARIARRRHGDTAVIRALSRSERAPAQGISAF
jgi:hypothetical protein